MSNYLLGENNTVREVAASDITPGTFAFTAAGQALFYSGADTIKSGELVAPYIGGVTIVVDKANASDTFALGADVFGSTANQNALTVGGDGTLGICAEASANGDTQVAVRLIN